MSLFGPRDPFLQAAEGTAKQLEARYRAEWEIQTAQLKDLGAYAAVVEQLSHLSAGGIHVDVGCSTAVLLGLVRTAYPDAIPIGLEHNPAALEAATRRLLRLDHLSKRHGRRKFVRAEGQAVDGSAQADVTYTYSPVESIDPSRIHLVLGDIRDQEVLSFLLGDQSVDSVSFTFPGAGGAPIVRAPYAPQSAEGILSDAEKDLKNMQLGAVCRRNMNHFAAARVRPGGRLVLAERNPYRVPSGDTDDVDAVREAARQTLLDLYPRLMETSLRFWEPGESRIVTEVDRSELGGVELSTVMDGQASHSAFEGEQGMLITTQVFLRNDVPYDPESRASDETLRGIERVLGLTDGLKDRKARPKKPRSVPGQCDGGSEPGSRRRRRRK